MRAKVLVITFVLGCSNTPSEPDAAAPTGYGGGCPSAQPQPPAMCSTEGVECEYPGMEDFCTNVFQCMGGQFDSEIGYCGTADITGTLCATTFAGVPAGQACSTIVQCDYVDGRCTCAGKGDAGADAGLVWSCTETPAGCPAMRPLLGMNCAPTGKVCDYGACFVEDTTFASPLALRCTGGIWIRAGCGE
jgi:hypothetical protein